MSTRSLAALACALLAAACSDPDDGEPISESCREATEHSDLAWIQDNVFTPTCAAFSPCHQGAAVSARGLNLEAGMSEAAMVGVSSTTDPNLALVEPGDPAASYLMHSLGVGGNPRVLMPFNNPALCQEKLDAIARWIESLDPGGP
jgi:hypothetical protein